MILLMKGGIVDDEENAPRREGHRLAASMSFVRTNKEKAIFIDYALGSTSPHRIYFEDRYFDEIWSVDACDDRNRRSPLIRIPVQWIGNKISPRSIGHHTVERIEVQFCASDGRGVSQVMWHSPDVRATRRVCPTIM